MKKINSTFSRAQEQSKEEEGLYEYGEGITKKLLEKYKPSEAIKVLNSTKKRHEESRAA